MLRIYNIISMTKFTKANWMTRQLAENLCVMGEQLKMARMRRNLTMEIVAARAQCSRQTLEDWKVAHLKFQ